MGESGGPPGLLEVATMVHLILGVLRAAVGLVAGVAGRREAAIRSARRRPSRHADVVVRARLQLTDSRGLTVVNRPSSRRFGLSGIFNLSRSFSIMVTGEELIDDSTTANRGLLGLTFRF